MGHATKDINIVDYKFADFLSLLIPFILSLSILTFFMITGHLFDSLCPFINQVLCFATYGCCHPCSSVDYPLDIFALAKHICQTK